MSIPAIRQSDRGFGLMFAVVFGVLYGAVWLIFDAAWHWAGVLAAVFLVLAYACPWLLMPLNRMWARFAARLGHVNNHLVLGVFYALMIIPAGLIMRVVGADPMGRRSNKEAASYWQPVRRNPDAENLQDMF